MVLRVPPYAGECRLVRVTSVLIFAHAQCSCCFCVSAEAPGQPGISVPQPTHTGDLRRAPTDPDPARPSRPDGGSLPQRGAPAGPPARITRPLSKRHRGHPADPPSPHVSVWAPRADKTTQSNKNRPLNILKSHITIPCASWPASRICPAATDQPSLRAAIPWRRGLE
jgi:hypothetical protein